MTPDTSAIIDALRDDISQAADVMLSAAEMGLRDIGAARAGRVEALDRLESTLSAILEACAFHDIAGQRLTKLAGAITNVQLPGAEADPLLNGPALHGEGLSQAAVDGLMSAASGAG